MLSTSVIHFSTFLCSNKSCSTLRICLIMTRSASPLLSAWPRTSWTSPTAGVRFYWVIWESTASWSSMVPFPETQKAPQDPTKTTRAAKGFTGLAQAECCGLTSRERRGLVAQRLFCISIKTGLSHAPVIHWEPLVPSSVFIKHNYCKRIYFHQRYSITGPWTNEEDRLDNMIPSLPCYQLLCCVSRMPTCRRVISDVWGLVSALLGGMDTS